MSEAVDVALGTLILLGLGGASWVVIRDICRDRGILSAIAGLLVASTIMVLIGSWNVGTGIWRDDYAHQPGRFEPKRMNHNGLNNAVRLGVAVLGPGLLGLSRGNQDRKQSNRANGKTG